MSTKYFTNYYTAKKYAEKRGLKEVIYGDTTYTLGGQAVSYVGYNKTGDRDDEITVLCYYGWERDIVRGRWVPIRVNKNGVGQRLMDLINH